MEAAEFAAVEFGGADAAQDSHGQEADLKVLVDAVAVEAIGHAGQLKLAVERLIGDAEQRAVWHAEAEAVGGDRAGLHIQGDTTRLG